MTQQQGPVPSDRPTARRGHRRRRGRLLLCVITAAVLGGGAVATAGPAMAIIGGSDASTGYPFMASIQRADGTHFCGGSLIAAQWVVTAAHCVVYAQQFPLDSLRVRVGSPDRTTGGTSTGVGGLFAHPQFVVDPILVNDIALVKLDRPVHQRPIRIAATAPPVATTTRTLGWGCVHPHTDEQPCVMAGYPTWLQELDIRIAPDPLCAPAGFTTGLDVCSESITPGSQACGGDSGGPLMIQVHRQWRLIGAASRGTGVEGDPPCTTGKMVYTDITAYRPWIAQTISTS